MQLKFFDVECAIGVIDLKTHDVELHHSLIKRQVLHEFDNIFYLAHPPVFFKDKEKYFLVARHWVYAVFVDNGFFKIPALIVNDAKLLEQVFRIDESEISTIFNKGRAEGESIDKPKSRKTETKYKAISTGRICPFCGGPLRGPRSRRPFEGGKYKITCENKSNKNIGDGKGCDFYAILTDEEFQLFNKYELLTSKWLRRLDDKKCPRCNSEVFLRIGKDPVTGNLISFERCRNYNNSTIKNCTYNQKIKGEYASVP